MARPSPVPWPTSLVVKNGSKIRGRTSAAMPRPVVADGDDDAVPSRVDRSRSRSRRARSVAGDGVLGVDQDVQQRLLQQQRIADDRRGRSRPCVADDLDVGPARASAARLASARVMTRSIRSRRRVMRCEPGEHQQVAGRSSRRDRPRGRSAANRGAVRLFRGVPCGAGVTISSSRWPSTPCSGLFISCAMPATNWPSDASFSDCASRARSVVALGFEPRLSRDVARDEHACRP